MRYLLLVFALTTFISAELRAQDAAIDSLTTLINQPAGDDTLKVDHLINLSKLYYNIAPDKAIITATRAANLGRKINYLKGVGYALKSEGIAYYYQGKYLESLGAWEKSLNVLDSINHREGVANLLSNIGAIYYNESDYNNALDYYLRSLRVAEEIKDTLRIVTALTNIGAVYNDKPASHAKALEYALRALELSEKTNAKDAIATSSVNIGEIYLFKKDYDRALEYFNKSLNAMQGTDGTIYTTINIGKVYAGKGEHKKALQYLNDAYAEALRLNSVPNQSYALLAMGSVHGERNEVASALKNYKEAAALGRKINSLLDLKSAYEGITELYKKQQKFDSAYKYMYLASVVKDSLYNIETDRQLSSQMFNFQIEKKQNEINLLKKDQEMKALDIRKQKIIRNLVIAGFISVIIFLAVAIFQNKRISRERGKSEALLLNILPYEVAQELKEKGQSEARDYEQVTVLFTDFKNFTSLAESMSAKELVEEVNYYFRAFDQIISRYGIEKIKTIGDSYMAAGGLPVPGPRSPEKVVLAALEMQQVLTDRQKQEENYPNNFEMRIGIHTGPVVAGIVGVKKFQYDIWGDTVNTASRMETSGEPGKVNISEATYRIINSNGAFGFEHRGKIEAKGKGKIDMYFVYLKDHSNSNGQPETATESIST